MNEKLLELMEVQGEIKVSLVKAGLSQAMAHSTAAGILDYVARSSIVTEEHRKAYTANH